MAILFTSNSKLAKSKVTLNLFLFLLIANCQDVWYRRLPADAGSYRREFSGVWKKKTNPRSALNSSWHKNEWSEEIQFRNNLNFIKTYESIDFTGNTIVKKKVEGSGSYSMHKNWILLTTKSINIIEKHDGELIKNTSKVIDSSLLYYYYSDGNIIIPMIYDVGYNEEDFGVKDGVYKPYDDSNSNFFRFIKIYAFKEFQSHAYYPEN